jgi:hypothetical protein
MTNPLSAHFIKVALCFGLVGAAGPSDCVSRAMTDFLGNEMH